MSVGVPFLSFRPIRENTLDFDRPKLGEGGKTSTGGTRSLISLVDALHYYALRVWGVVLVRGVAERAGKE